jgi:hypothetical protein
VENVIDSYEGALALDLSVMLICAGLLLRYGNLSFAHPAISYLTFHLYVVTLRLLALVSGDVRTLFASWSGPFDPVMPGEIARAALYFDVALVVMTITWLSLRAQRPARPAESSVRLNPSRVWAVIVVAFPIGLVGIFVAAQIPTFEANERLAGLGEWQTSSYIAITQTWCGLALLAYIYCYGFRKIPVVLLTLYILIMVFQGYHRFRVVIPILMLCQIWLDRRRLAWPPKWMFAGLLAVALLFFPLKTIGRMWQAGSSLSDVGTAVWETTLQATSGQTDDQMFLDQAASTLTLVDMSGHRYWGSIWLALATLPIPRQWWPDKPGLADFIRDISIPSRPMAETGMVTTFIGEAYANFGFAGVLLVPPLLAWVLTLLYRRAYQSGYYTVLRFGYVLICVSLIQVYRDGLTSLVVFTMVNTLPLIAIVAIHLVPRARPALAALRARVQPSR